MRKLPYREGDIFAVSLTDGKFALGVVARAPKGGRVLLGYFFPDKLSEIPAKIEVPTLVPENALKVAKFGDLHLIDGKWPVVGHVENWDRSNWPMPMFIREDPIGQSARLVSYSDNDPNQQITEQPCDFGTEGFETDSLWGAGYTELLLTKLCRSQP